MNGSNLPLVSVGIPAYNHEKYIQKTIRSIIAQTYQNIELIVIDDGSEDSTWQKIQELKQECEKRFVRIDFSTQENCGVCKTSNKIKAKAQGEFIYSIASDDLAKPQAIEKQLDFLLKNKDYALAVGDNEIIDSEGKRAYWDNERNLIYDENKAKHKTFGSSLRAGKYPISNPEQFGTYENLLRGNHIPNGSLIRKSVFDEIGDFTPEAPLEDYWSMLQISKRAKLKYIDEVLFSYRWHGKNTAAQTERMEKMTEKTLEYEKNKYIGNNRRLNDILRYRNCKILFRIPPVLTIYKKKKGKNRTIYADILSRSFVLYKYSVSEAQ